MTSFKPSRRERRIDIVTSVIIKKKASAVVTKAHKEKDVVCLYIQSWVNESRVKKILTNTEAVIELINSKLIATLYLQIYEMKEE